MTQIKFLLFIVCFNFIKKVVTEELMIYRGEASLSYSYYYKDRPLLCISDNPKDAITWNTHFEWNYPEQALREKQSLQASKLSSNPKYYPGQCYLNVDSSECLSAWKQYDSNWSLTSSFIKPMGPVFDSRWEHFPEYKTFDPVSTEFRPILTSRNGAYSSLLFGETGSLTVSIRGASNAHFALCESDQYNKDFCYWLIIGGWNNNNTAIRKCPSGIPSGIPAERSECRVIRASFINHFPLSNREWKTFVITWEASSRTIALYDPNKRVLSYTDYESSRTNKKYHIFYRGPDEKVPLLFRYHEYTYTLVSQPEAKLVSPTLIDNVQDFCVDMLIGLCRECELFISLLDGNGDYHLRKRFSGSIYNRVDHDLAMWQYGQFNVSNIRQYKAPLRLEISTNLKTSSDEKNNHWAISNLQECLPKKTVKTLMMTANQDYDGTYFWPEVTCQRLSYNSQHSKTISAIQQVSAAPRNTTLCPAYYIGPYCETDCHKIFKNNCAYVTVCNENGCYCSQGYTNSDCMNGCYVGSYGYGCSKLCNNCFNNYCHSYTGTCISGCKDIIDHFYVPPYCEIDIEPPQAPEFDQLSETSVRVHFEEIDNYRKVNATFVFEMMSFHGITETKAADETDTIISKTYYAIFTNLSPGNRYKTRVLLNIQFEEKYKNIAGSWRNFTTLCNADGKFETDRNETSLLLKKIQGQADNSCPDSWYSAALSAIFSSPNKSHTNKKYDTVPSFPLLFSNLIPFTKYRIQVNGNDKNYYDEELLTLEARPSSVVGLSYDVQKNNDVQVQWSSPIEPNGILQGYSLTIQIVRYRGCSDEVPFNSMTSKTFLISDFDDTITKTIDDLIPYVVYGIIVFAYNTKLGFESKVVFQTNEAEIPTAVYSDINFANSKITWKDPADCRTITGPIGGARLFFLGLSENVRNFSDSYDTRYHSFELNRTKKQTVYGAEKYMVRVHTLRQLYGIHNETAYIELSFTTDPKPPPKVNELEIVEVNVQNKSTTLRWKKPSPPTNGEISEYCIQFSKGNKKPTPVCVPAESVCQLWENLLCATVEQPSGQGKFIEVRAYNKGVDNPGEENRVPDIRDETKPSAPKILDIKEIDKGVVYIKWQHPFKTGGPMKKFVVYYKIISTQLEKVPNSYDFSSIQFPISSYKIDYNTALNLLPSTRYKISIQGMNTLRGEVSSTEIETASSLAFEFEPQPIVDNEESQINIIIPPIVNNTKGSLLHIIVKGPSICKQGTMLSSALEKDIGVEYHEVAWRVATLPANKLSNSSFTIGDDEVYDGIVNCPLHVGASYGVVLVVHEKDDDVLKKATTITWKSEPLHIGPIPNKNHEVWAIPLVLTLIIIGGAVHFYIKRRNGICLRDKEDSINSEVLVPLPTIPPKERKTHEHVDKEKLLPPKVEQRESLFLTPAHSVEQLKSYPVDETIYENLKSTSLVKLNEFQDYVKQAIASGKLDEQYAIFPRGQTKSWEYGKLPQNKSKNRYGNLIAYDETRVILEKFPDDPYSDYINANYIKGYKKNKAYIATQGPKPNTLNDFWRMVWHERVQVICMLANVIEGGKTKCEQYWPEIGQELKFGKVSVTNISHTDFADYTTRVLHVTCDQETRKIDHFHYTSWPDHGIPLYTQSVVTYLKKLLATPAGNGPVLVHCSAGVGRTGTIILCDICLRRAAAEGVVDVFGETELIRRQRANMVDNKQQYLLAHVVLVECLLTLPTTIACNDSLSTRIQEFKQQLNLQQQRIEESAWQDEALQPISSFSLKLSDKNISKNRFPDLATSPNFYIARYPSTDEDSNYISGVYVDSARRRNNYIASQIPMPTTVGDFWRMIAELKVKLIIMLQPIDPTDPTCCKFFPDPDEEIKPVPFITLKGRDIVNTNIFSQRKIVLTDKSDKIEREQITTILICNESEPGKSKPPKPSILVDLWQAAERISRNTEATVVLCYDGVTNCGLYIAMSFLLERMGLEHECDVCLAVRAIRRSRKDFCKTLDQLDYLYNTALLYADYFETYANFS
ncbi:receptor-type tyrosine-protein phosphatase delta [Microplitis demolitor]|uniref:receptor-type tyrosine-protein phosphatase delta n=1 Tax=Microplitis demolitor TaxID=69319 RepID=UPI0004CC9BD8|nr:receptor-type tyrosine-protein phosphatase delta [Microplitis demolitor]